MKICGNSRGQEMTVRYKILLVATLIGAMRPSEADTTQTLIESRQVESPARVESSFTVPPFSVEHQVRLSLEARTVWETLAGSNFWIRVAVNGNYLTKPDLLNKRPEFKLRNGIDLAWSDGDRWRVLYSPDFEAAVTQKDHPYSCADADPYHFVWDITRHVHPGENSFRIEYLQVLAKPTTLGLRNVKIEVGRPISAPENEDVAPAPTGPLPTFVAKGPTKVEMEVRLASSGGMKVGISGKQFSLSTRTSLPDSQWYETRAEVATNRIGIGKSGTTSWKTDSYRVDRKVTVGADHIHIADTLSNPGKELVGVILEHQLLYQDRPMKACVAGREAFSEKAVDYNACHPSAFAQWKELGVGLVAEDDVFRVHIKSFSETGGIFGDIGLADEQLGIPPGSSVTLEWSIYPVPKGDYWDFVNAVRRNWGSNFTIPGPFAFTMHFRGAHPAEWYGDWVRKRSLKIVCGGIATYPDGKYAHGTGIEHAPKWVAFERDWTQKMLAAAPEVKALAYFHTQCSTEPDGVAKYADSRLIDEKGEHVHYPYHYPLPLYLPTRENSYGKALWGYVRTCLDEIGVSGLYWDEMSHSVLDYAYQAPWDGHTVIIDPKTHAVIGKRSSVALLMQPLQLDIINHLRQRGKFLMGNTQPTTRTMLQQKIVRFVETGTYSAVSETHLGCPLGLGNHHAEGTHADSALNVRRILEYGGIYYGHLYDRNPAPWNFTEVMFPITPVEIREGMVLGEERIHTARSGRFGWPDGSAAGVYVVDGQGSRVASPMVKEVRENGRRLYEIRMPGDHFAVLVKKK